MVFLRGGTSTPSFFPGITLNHVKAEAGRWAHWTMAAYINRWNPEAGSVLGALATLEAGSSNAPKGIRHHMGKGKSCKRSLGDSSVGSVAGSAAASGADEEDEEDDWAGEGHRWR